jgi:hypothetical protein
MAYAARWKTTQADLPAPLATHIGACALLLCEMMFKTSPDSKSPEAQAEKRRQIGQHLKAIQQTKLNFKG